MQPRPDATSTTSPAPSPTDAARRSASAAASSVASSAALSLRVAELEGLLAAERAQGVARAREVDGGVQILRKALQDLQVEVRRARDERARLQEQLEQSRRIVASMTASAPDDADPDVVEELEGALETARSEIADARNALGAARVDADALAGRVRALEADLKVRDAELGRCAAELASRDAELSRLRERVDEIETELADARRVAAAAAAPEAVAVAETPAVEATHAASAATVADAAAEAAPETPSEAAASPETTAADDPSFPPVPGFRIERFVGDGTWGRTYEAREIATRRPVMVRVLPTVLGLLDGKRLDAVLLAKHPAIVAVLSFAVGRDGPYLVTEREDGETAADWVRRIGPLPERIAVSIAFEAARGLRHAASHGAVHGDLAPDQLLIDVTGRVRVRGVGLRSVIQRRDGADDAPCAAPFAAPERLRAGGAVDVRTDIYALGAVLHFLLTGKPPYEGDRTAVARAQTANAVRDVREVRSDVSETTARIVRKLLQSEPDSRHQTWDQLLIEFERQVPGQLSTALRGTFATRSRRFVTAHPWVIGAALAGLILAAGFTRAVVARDPSAALRFAEACTIAEKLEAAGDVEGARHVYRRFLSGTGDADVERTAGERYDRLEPR